AFFEDTTDINEDAFILQFNTCSYNSLKTSTPSTTICSGSSTTLNVSGAESYSWSPSTGLSLTNTATPIASPTVTTTYTVIGCSSVTDSVIVNVNPAPAVVACCNTTIDARQSTALSVSPILNTNTYYWTPPNGLSCTICPNPNASPLVNTVYYVTITDSIGCTKIDTVIIDVVCGNLFIPEAFSPNGDGQNDKLYVRDDCIKTMNFVVFDRWGNKVFETNDQNLPWDGTYKGKALNAGSYVYYLNATMYDGTSVTKKGNVALVR
ncbi:MAG TPA: gliding motility-associated C-terminal domain-containing protein, partial [Bacteroidia bacterium]|nr:gliding motility-associated C-terminal domain-containing protein [Bacteroidia bacterium]